MLFRMAYKTIVLILYGIFLTFPSSSVHRFQPDCKLAGTVKKNNTVMNKQDLHFCS